MAGRRRALTSVQIIAQAGIVTPGDVFELKLPAFTADERPAVQALIAGDPRIAHALWTGLGGRRAFGWAHDGQHYSPTGIVVRIFEMPHLDKFSVPGPDYWIVPGSRRSMHEESKRLEAELA